MLKQQYDAKALLTVIKKDDIRRWRLWDNKKERYKIAENLAKSIEEKNFTVGELRTSMFKGKIVYCPIIAVDFFALKLLDRYIRRIYKVIQSDRARIVRQIKVLLEDSGDFSLLRNDIKSFYEMINFDKCIEKFKNDMLLSSRGISLLNSLKERYQNTNGVTTGLPRGIGLSATLSEIYLRDLDKMLTEHPDVIFCSRYVDDIFILTDRSKAQIVKNMLIMKTQELDLVLNP